ncbi:ROK family transcriptional regulator [Catenulispora pinisilvae]|uniref:ROK family transcriptional regulator n=1 Tax=Catenulispora pinisilvae TaxID=2705253 RepID=UPI001890FE36|nr:ROK family transcriptional regulator [Catenulispora pinisilvae]
MSDQVATGPHVLRRINISAVLGALRAAEDATARVSDLMAATGLSRPAVTRALAALGRAGVVAFLDAEPTALGRPAARARFRAELGHVAGIDIGPRTMTVAIADLSGAVRAHRRLATPPQPTGPRLVELMRSGLEELAQEAGVPVGSLWAVGLGTPGIVDHERGVVVVAPSIPGWTGLPMLSGLRDWLGCPVLIDNDVNLAVLAERQVGAGAAGTTMLYVHWGERIGAGLVVDGKPYRGASSAAGELGFLDLLTPVDDTPPGVAGGLGPFERLAGAAEIRRLAGIDDGTLTSDPADPADPAEADRADANSTDRADPTDRADLRPFFDAIASGEPAAMAVLDQVAGRFARGLAAMVLMLDPGRVVIGGGLAHGGDVLLDAVRRRLEPLLLVPCEVRLSALRENAVALGAVRMALDHAEQRLTDM